MAFLGVLSVFSSRAKVGRKKSQLFIYWESWLFYGVAQLITSWDTVYQRNISRFPNRIWEIELWFSFPSWLERASIWQYLVFLWIMLDIIEYSSTIPILSRMSGWTCDVYKSKLKKVIGRIARWSLRYPMFFLIYLFFFVSSRKFSSPRIRKTRRQTKTQEDDAHTTTTTTTSGRCDGEVKYGDGRCI